MSILGDKQFGVEVAKHLDEERKRLGEWKDISTAPQDGTPVLVAWAGINMHPLVAHYEEPFWGALTSSLGFDKLHDPTHWMPLPTPPEVE